MEKRGLVLTVVLVLGAAFLASSFSDVGMVSNRMPLRTIDYSAPTASISGGEITYGASNNNQDANEQEEDLCPKPQLPACTTEGTKYKCAEVGFSESGNAYQLPPYFFDANGKILPGFKPKIDELYEWAKKGISSCRTPSSSAFRKSLAEGSKKDLLNSDNYKAYKESCKESKNGNCVYSEEIIIQGVECETFKCVITPPPAPDENGSMRCSYPMNVRIYASCLPRPN